MFPSLITDWFGIFRPSDVTEKVTLKALELGYRHVSHKSKPLAKYGSLVLTLFRWIAPKSTAMRKKALKPSASQDWTDLKSSTLARFPAHAWVTRKPSKLLKRALRLPILATLTCMHIHIS